MKKIWKKIDFIQWLQIIIKRKKLYLLSSIAFISLVALIISFSTGRRNEEYVMSFSSIPDNSYYSTDEPYNENILLTRAAIEYAGEKCNVSKDIVEAIIVRRLVRFTSFDGVSNVYVSSKYFTEEEAKSFLIALCDFPAHYLEYSKEKTSLEKVVESYEEETEYGVQINDYEELLSTIKASYQELVKSDESVYAVCNVELIRLDSYINLNVGHSLYLELHDNGYVKSLEDIPYYEKRKEICENEIALNSIFINSLSNKISSLSSQLPDNGAEAQIEELTEAMQKTIRRNIELDYQVELYTNCISQAKVNPEEQAKFKQDFLEYKNTVSSLLRRYEEVYSSSRDRLQNQNFKVETNKPQAKVIIVTSFISGIVLAAVSTYFVDYYLKKREEKNSNKD